MKDLSNSLIVLFVLIVLSSCLVMEEEFSAIPPGEWRGILYLGDTPVPGAISMGASDADNKLPFNFEVKYITGDSFHVIIKNGPERIILKDVDFGHNRATGRDSLICRFPEYGSYIMAYYEEDMLEGKWYVPSKGSYSIPFMAHYGGADRFNRFSLKEKNDVSGIWSVEFGIENPEDRWPAVGEFEQDGHNVVGTFLTETGDYRYLEGIVDGNNLWLSCFDGSHAFLFKSKIIGDSLIGFFKSGNRYQTLWEANRNDNANLKDPFELTKVDSIIHFDFSYVNTEGDSARFSDLKFTGKPRIVQIFGTWCPNCKDETIFLVDYLKENPNSIDVVGVAFERAKTVQEGYQTIANYKRIMDIPYPVIYGGEASKKVASEVFSNLSGITSFPTMIFLSPENEIYKVQTGFNGPATSKFDGFKKFFSQYIEELKK